MAKNSKIEWTDHTVNLWWGCSKVHTGCKNCYAEYQSDKMKRGTRNGSKLWGEKTYRRKIKSAFSDLGKYQAQAKKEGKMAKIFCGSMMDIFEDSKPLVDINGNILEGSTGDLREELFQDIMGGMYENLIFLFLTKRPNNIGKMIPLEWKNGVKSVFFGTSISDTETLKYADELKQLKFQNLFLSIEPQIGPIMTDEIDLKGIDWVIQGGESGYNKRPFDLAWAYEMKEICELYGVPYFFKQIDKRQAIPEDLMIREFPEFINQ